MTSARAAGGEIARQWFVPAEGIDRHVISADIQRYLGNDATVRPGLGTGQDDVGLRYMPRKAGHAYSRLGCSRLLDQGVSQSHKRRHTTIPGASLKDSLTACYRP